MEHSSQFIVLVFLTFVICCVYSQKSTYGLRSAEDHDESHQPQKRSPVFSEDFDVVDDLDDKGDLDKKSTLFRFGKRGTLLRFGKRGGSLFRFGRSGPADSESLDEGKRTLFRFGKRSNLEDRLKEMLSQEELHQNIPLFSDSPVDKRNFHWGSDSDK